MRTLVESIEAAFCSYKTLADKAIAQVGDEALFWTPSEESNSIAVIAKHIGGNLASRFTDFLTSDGEKPWRQRDEEFEAGTATRQAVLAQWERGWSVLLATLASLTDADLTRGVTVRGEPLPVHGALHRSLAHTASHVGQIIYAAKASSGKDWATLSIPRRPSPSATQAPAPDRADDHRPRLPGGDDRPR